jgi:hypothetical protein
MQAENGGQHEFVAGDHAVGADDGHIAQRTSMVELLVAETDLRQRFRIGADEHILHLKMLSSKVNH